MMKSDNNLARPVYHAPIRRNLMVLAFIASLAAGAYTIIAATVAITHAVGTPQPSPTLASSGDVNDFAPTSLRRATSTPAPLSSNVLRITATGPATVTGLRDGTSNRIIVLENASQWPVLLLPDDGSISDAADRLITDDSLTWLVPERASMALRYDGISQRWRMLGDTTAIFAGRMNRFLDVANVHYDATTHTWSLLR